MHIHNKRAACLAASVLVLIFIISLILSYISIKEVLSFYQLYKKLLLPETLNMMLETGMLFTGFCLCGLTLKKTNIRYAAFILTASAFLWLHRIFLPVAASALFIIGLIMLGELVLAAAGRRTVERALRLLHNFVAGASAYISSICVLSLFKLGNMKYIYIYTLCLFAGSAFLLNRLKLSPLKEAGLKGQIQAVTDKTRFKKDNKLHTLIFCAILTMLLLQAGRINIALDYDSLHYGLRTPYILNNGFGIYEHLGLANDVYYYPKGLEILTMPLNISVSYGFIIAFSWWLLAAMLFTLYDIVRKITDTSYALFAAGLAAFVPGIMNMGVSAKTDIITLLIQLIFVDNMISYIRNKYVLNIKSQVLSHLIWGFALLLFSLIFKPTSVVFSGLLFIAAVLAVFYIASKDQAIKKAENYKINIKEFIVLLPVSASFLLVTLRTLLMTGYPITSAYSAFWRKLGIQALYPFAFEGYYSTGSNTGGLSEKINLIKRIRGLFVSPVGEDMVHVFIAFAGVLIMVLIVLIFLCGIIARKKSDALSLYININCLLLIISSILILRIIYQVDGNYFMLTYALVIIAAANAAYRFFGTDKSNKVKPALILALLPALAWAFAITCVTNWAGACGFTPPLLIHGGFYNHHKAEYMQMEKNGTAKISDYLQYFPRARVIAMADRLEGLNFKCCVQSYTDVVGSGGNARLVHNLKKFKRYLDFAGVEYIYINQNFLDEHRRACEVERDMVKEGSLMLLIKSGDSKLYRYIHLASE